MFDWWWVLLHIFSNVFQTEVQRRHLTWFFWHSARPPALSLISSPTPLKVKWRPEPRRSPLTTTLSSESAAGGGLELIVYTGATSSVNTHPESAPPAAPRSLHLAATMCLNPDKLSHRPLLRVRPSANTHLTAPPNQTKLRFASGLLPDRSSYDLICERDSIQGKWRVWGRKIRIRIKAKCLHIQGIWFGVQWCVCKHGKRL